MNTKDDKIIEVTCRGADVLPFDSLENFQGNLKKITKANLEKLKKRIIRDGINVPLFVWRVNDWCRILDGHQRLKALQSLREDGYILPMIPVCYIDAENEKDARQKLLGITSQFGEFELEELNEWMNEIDNDIAETLRFTEGEIKIDFDIPTAEEDDFDIPEDIQTDIKLGDLFLIGEHRLLCGDSTDPEQVARLMDGKKADMVFTDPPYGISYADKNRYLNAISRGNRIQIPIKNDHMELNDTSDFIYKSFISIKSILSKRSSYYITAPQGGDLMMMMMMMMAKAGIPLRHCLIWVKNNHVLGRTDYNYKHEPILYGWIDVHVFYGNGKYIFSTWEIPKPLKNDLHPTMKPIALIENAMNNSTKEFDIVADIFLGSGSTMVAGHQLKRKVYGMELDPKYCQVIIDRMKKLDPNIKIIKC